MVAIIVNDRHAIPFAGAGEASAHAAEAGQRLANELVPYPEFAGDRNRRGGIECVVTTWHRQRQILDLVHHLAGTITQDDREAGAAIGMLERGETHVRLQVFAVSDHATIGDLPNQELHYGMISAHHGKSIERHVFDERAKRLLHGDESPEVTEMLGIAI